MENTKNEVVDVVLDEGALEEVTEAAVDAIDVIDDVGDYDITIGDVAIIGFSAIGVGATAYALFKGGKKLFNWIKKKQEEKRWKDLEDSQESTADLADRDPDFPNHEPSEDDQNEEE